MIYTDNNGVRDVMISCTTKNVTARKLLIATLVLESSRCLWPWYNRLPSDSNTADGPSRLKIQKLLDAGATLEDINVYECWDAVEALAEKWGEEQASSRSHESK